MCSYRNVILAFFTAYRQSIVALPSESCAGHAVTLRCETLRTINNVTSLRSATFDRDGNEIRSDTPNHMFLFSETEIVGVVVNVTLDDDGIEYTCTTSGAHSNFVSSLTLNIIGMSIMYVWSYIHILHAFSYTSVYGRAHLKVYSGMQFNHE